MFLEKITLSIMDGNTMYWERLQQIHKKTVQHSA
jgi:hypothetical protein